MPNRTKLRNRMTPWWIGLAIILVAIAIAAYPFWSLDCGPMDGVLALFVLGIIPAVYLTLMYLTFKSEADSERE
jgi:hypothetical protein